MARGYWSLNAEMSDNSELSDCDLEQIASLVKQGFTEGELVHEDEEIDEEDEDIKCYYNNNQCEGGSWECVKCNETFCFSHSHSTSKGSNIECVSCERERNQTEKEK